MIGFLRHSLLFMASVGPLLAALPARAAGPATVAPPTVELPGSQAGTVPLPDARGPQQQGPWFGIGPALTVQDGPANTVSNVALSGGTALHPHIEIWGRMLWPLLARTVDNELIRARRWSFGASLGAAYAFGSTAWPVRPLLGATTGVTALLAEGELKDAGLQSNTESRFAPTLAAWSGLRCGLSAHTSLLATAEWGKAFFASDAGAHLAGLDTGRGRFFRGILLLSWSQ